MGSTFVAVYGGKKILMDRHIFQGTYCRKAEFDERNWRPGASRVNNIYPDIESFKLSFTNTYKSRTASRNSPEITQHDPSSNGCRDYFTTLFVTSRGETNWDGLYVKIIKYQLELFLAWGFSLIETLISPLMMKIISVIDKSFKSTLKKNWLCGLKFSIKL